MGPVWSEGLHLLENEALDNGFGELYSILEI